MKRHLLFSLTFLLATASLAQAQVVPVTTASDEARVHYVRGIHNAAYLNFDRARGHFDAALEADPDFALAHLYRGWLSTTDKRAEHLRQASVNAATDAERQMIEAYQANLRDDYDRERELYEGLAEQYPDDPLPMFFLASTQSFNQGSNAQAAATARRALAADPSFAAAYNVIGYAEMAQGNGAAAEHAFREQIRLAPDEPNPNDSYGEFLMNRGRLDEAEAQFETALTKNPAFEVSRDNLTRIAIMQATEAFVAAINRSDLDAYANFYTAGAVMSLPDGSELVGREALREVVRALFASGPVSIEFYTKENMPMGDDYVYQRGALTTEINGTIEQGVATHIWAKTPDGWKIIRDMWTSAPASSGTN